jgi:hypothetical protein
MLPQQSGRAKRSIDYMEIDEISLVKVWEDACLNRQELLTTNQGQVSLDHADQSSNTLK